MRVDKMFFRRVLNSSKYLEFNSLQFFQTFPDHNDIDIIKKELDYLIKNDVYHKVINSSKTLFWGNQIYIKKEFEQDFKLLEKYTIFFQQKETLFDQ